MTRPLNSSTSAVLSEETLYPGLLVELKFSEMTLRLTSLTRDVTYGNLIYVSNGWLLPIDGIQQSTDIGNYGFDLALNGISTALMSLILGNEDASERGTVWLAFFTSSGSVVGAPILLYRGLIDSTQIDDKLENPTAVVKLENDLGRFDTSQNFRFTDESQKAYYPEDRGFEYVESLDDWSGFWGKSERPKWLRRKSTKKDG